MDAVAPGAWEEVAERDGDGVVVRWPYFERRGPLGMRRLLSPPLTPRLGPLFADSLDPKRDLGAWSRALGSVAAQLPPADQFLQAFHPGITYWTPLEWLGFRESTHFTFVIDPLPDIDAARRRYSKGTRSDLKKAQRHLVVRDDTPVSFTYDALVATLVSAGKSLDFSCELLERVHGEVSRRDRGVHLTVMDEVGTFLAGGLAVWDEERAYYLMAGATEQARGSGAQTLLVDEAIRIALSRGLTFDFEGSRIANIERFFRGFGGRPEPYAQLERLTTKAETALFARHLAQTARTRVRIFKRS